MRLTGKAVSGFAGDALERGTAGDHPAVAYGLWQDWLGFLRDATWFTPTFAKLIAVGEVAIGVALILGAFTGIAAFFGATGTLGQPGRWFTRHRTPTTTPTPA